MTTAKPQQDNLFGVCAALGEDFGFDPLWLRLALGLGLLWNMEVIIGSYFVVGAAVLVSRLLFPKAKRVAAVAPPVAITAQNIEAAPDFAQAA